MTNTVVASKEVEVVELVTRTVNLKEMLKTLKDDEVFFNPDGILIGKIENIEVLDRTNKDKQQYNQIQINVKDSEGKSFNKRYSVDFTRKYFLQLGKKAADMPGAVVVFKPTNKYKAIGWWAFVVEIDGKLNIKPYVDDGADFSEKLAKLGL